MASVNIQETFSSAITSADILNDTAVTTGQFHIIGEKKIEAGEMVRLGNGTNDSMEGSIGRIYADIRDNAAAPGVEMNGTIRFSVHSPQGRPLRILKEFRTESLRSDANNRTLQLPFSVNGMPFISEDKKLIVEFKPDAAGTVSKTNTKLLMDITQAVV